MDQNVIDAVAKWPDVPAVYGWLSLDRRGNWRIKGGVVTNPAVAAFIGRNYTCDKRGAWFFQNGPQRVFVALDGAPWVLRMTLPGRLETHTGVAVTAPTQAWIDDGGNLLLATEHGMGLVCDRDLPALLEMIHDGSGQPATEDQLLKLMAGASLPLQLRFVGAALPISPIAGDDIPATGRYIAVPASES